MTPKLIVEQKITALVNKYVIYEAQPDGSKGKLLALAQQKRLAFKEKVLFYTDQSRSNHLFSFRAEKVLDIHGNFIVEDPAGKRIGAFKKDFTQSLLSSTWYVIDDTDVPQLQIRESNDVLAALRRYAGYVPILGDLAELVLIFFKYHFTFRSMDGAHELGSYKKTTLFRDHYVLSMDEQAYSEYDWRVLASVAVALDALQSR